MGDKLSTLCFSRSNIVVPSFPQNFQTTRVAKKSIMAILWSGFWQLEKIGSRTDDQPPAVPRLIILAQTAGAAPFGSTRTSFQQ